MLHRCGRAWGLKTQHSVLSTAACITLLGCLCNMWFVNMHTRRKHAVQRYPHATEQRPGALGSQLPTWRVVGKRREAAQHEAAVVRGDVPRGHADGGNARSKLFDGCQHAAQPLLGSGGHRVHGRWGGGAKLDARRHKDKVLHGRLLCLMTKAHRATHDGAVLHAPLAWQLAGLEGS